MCITETLSVRISNYLGDWFKNDKDIVHRKNKITLITSNVFLIPLIRIECNIITIWTYERKKCESKFRLVWNKDIL